MTCKYWPLVDLSPHRMQTIASQCQPSCPSSPKRSTRKRNERERNRVKHINSTFTVLRRTLPTSFGTRARKLSKVHIT